MYGLNILFTNDDEIIVPIGNIATTKALLHRLSTCDNNQICRLTDMVAINLKQVLTIKIIQSHEIKEEGGVIL